MNFLRKLFKIVFKKDDNFGIILYKNSTYCVDQIQNQKVILELDIDNLLKPKPLLTQADPFLFVKGDTLFLFYESQRSGDKGILRMIKTHDLNNWSNPITILSEPYHLSFPYVFEDAGITYMIPETQLANSIRLYKANPDLSQFKYVKTLLSKERTQDIMFNFSDSHLIKIDGVYYLFTSISYDWTYHLELYYSNDLLNQPFIKHPKSPIHIGNEFGRCGGSIIHLNNAYYRVSQDCHASYGENVSIHKITTINKEEYHEELYLHNIIRIGKEPFHDGGHHLNIVKYKDQYIYAHDFRNQGWCWYQMYAKAKRFVHRLIKSH